MINVIDEGVEAVYGCRVCGHMKTVRVSSEQASGVFWCQHGGTTLWGSAPCIMSYLDRVVCPATLTGKQLILEL